MELAERAYDLWGRILEAQMEHIAESSPILQPYPHQIEPIFIRIKDGSVEYMQGQPEELGAEVEDRTMQNYNTQIDHARELFDKALEEADKPPRLPGSSEARAQEVTSQPAASPVAKRRRSLHKPKQYHATTRTDEERADYTASLTEKMSEDLDYIHNQYRYSSSEITRKKEFLAKTTVIHLQTGEGPYRREIRNRFIAQQDELDQIVVWAGQAAGPRHSARLKNAGDRMGFVMSMINSGCLDENEMLDTDQLWEQVDEAVRLGLLTNTDDPRITGHGLEHIQALLAEDQQKDRPMAFRQR